MSYLFAFLSVCLVLLSPCARRSLGQILWHEAAWCCWCFLKPFMSRAHLKDVWRLELPGTAQGHMETGGWTWTASPPLPKARLHIGENRKNCLLTHHVRLAHLAIIGPLMECSFNPSSLSHHLFFFFSLLLCPPVKTFRWVSVEICTNRPKLCGDTLHSKGWTFAFFSHHAKIMAWQWPST